MQNIREVIDSIDERILIFQKCIEELNKRKEKLIAAREILKEQFLEKESGAGITPKRAFQDEAEATEDRHLPLRNFTIRGAITKILVSGDKSTSEIGFELVKGGKPIESGSLSSNLNSMCVGRIIERYTVGRQKNYMYRLITRPSGAMSGLIGKEAVLEVLKENSEGKTIDEISQDLIRGGRPIKNSTLNIYLHALCRDGSIQRVGGEKFKIIRFQEESRQGEIVNSRLDDVISRIKEATAAKDSNILAQGESSDPAEDAPGVITFDDIVSAMRDSDILGAEESLSDYLSLLVEKGHLERNGDKYRLK